MDKINKKALERMNDILDAIKVEIDAITGPSKNLDDDFIASDTILDLAKAFDIIYRKEE